MTDDTDIITKITLQASNGAGVYSHSIQAVKNRLVLSNIIRRYVDLRQISGRFMCSCPFHQETKPSMSVNDEEGFFYCFGCQASGDVIDFYKRINGLEFTEALEELAIETGVELKQKYDDPEIRAQQRRKKILLDIHDQALVFFQRNLGCQEGHMAREYLNLRGIEPRIVEAFSLGYSPDNWHGLDSFIKSKGYSQNHGVLAGLLSKNEKGNIYDRFNGRIIFPIKNLSGRIIAFGGRNISEREPKYLNSSDTPIYKKRDHLYGLYQARSTIIQSKRAILTEGYMDVLSLHQFGYTNSCGVLGTAITEEQIRLLARFCSRVDLIFDGDNAGRQAALKSSEMILLLGVSCRVVLMPEGEDVDSVLKKHGAVGLEKHLKVAKEGLAFCTDTLREEFAPRETMGWAKRFFEKLTDDSLRAYYLPRLVVGLGVAEIELRQILKTVHDGRHSVQKTKLLTELKLVGRDDNSDRYFLRFTIQYPEYVQALADRGLELILVTSWARDLWDKIKLYEGQDILPWLTDNEKFFWACCRQELVELKLSGEELRDEWLHICERMTRDHKRQDRKQLKENLREALLTGDERLALEHLQALNAFLGRDDE